MENTEQDNNLENIEDTESKIYEIGYLLVPFISTEQVSEVVNNSLKSIIVTLGGSVTSEMDPSMIKLAYQMTKIINNKHNKFNDAYFGALRFKILPGKMPEFKELLAKNENILRHLVISLPKGSENISIPKRPQSSRYEDKTFEIERIAPEKEEEKGEMTEEAMDKEIESLLVEPEAQ